MPETGNSAQTLINDLVAQFAALPMVAAIALGGSRSSGAADAASDIDLYIYTRGDVPLADREAIVRNTGGAAHADLGMTYWGPGDEWISAATGIEVDLIYFDATWMENQLDQVINQHQAGMGWSTCLWHTVRFSRMLYDPHGWYTRMQQLAETPYPKALRDAIIAINYPLLRQIIPSYLSQIEKAVTRGDLVSINHRVAALLASYFDILFAVNSVLHPGEKRLIQLAQANCPMLPLAMEQDVHAVLQAAGAEPKRVAASISQLLDHLDELLSHSTT